MRQYSDVNFDEKWNEHWLSFIRANNKFLFVLVKIISFFKIQRFMLPPTLHEFAKPKANHSYALLFCEDYLNFEEYFKKLNQNTKRNYKKALKNGLIFSLVQPTRENLATLERFSDKERAKQHAHVPSLFLECFHKFPDSKLIFIKNSDLDIVGAVSVLIYNKCLWMNWIFTNNYLNTKIGISFFTYINLVKFCFENNIKSINFGRSISGGGVERFKLNFGCNLRYKKSTEFAFLIRLFMPLLLFAFNLLQRLLLYLKAFTIYAVLFISLS